MDWGATNDPVTNTSDVYVLPEYNDEGIYLLDEAGMDTDPSPRRDTLERDLSTVRMRGGLVGKVSRENFRGRPSRFQPTGTQTFLQYRKTMPTQTELRSSRRGRPPIEQAGWDDRPPGFRPDDGPAASAFVPPPLVRPPRGGIITPWEISYAPSYSEAVMKASVPDPNMVGLAPCGAVPTAAHLAGRETFTGGASSGSYALGVQMGKIDTFLKIVVVLVIVVLLAMLCVTASTEKKIVKQIKIAIREAVEAIRSR